MTVRARPIRWEYLTNPVSSGAEMLLRGQQDLSRGILSGLSSVGAGIAARKQNAEVRRQFDAKNSLAQQEMGLRSQELSLRQQALKAHRDEQEANLDAQFSAVQAAGEGALAGDADLGEVHQTLLDGLKASVAKYASSEWAGPHAQEYEESLTGPDDATSKFYAANPTLDPKKSYDWDGYTANHPEAPETPEELAGRAAMADDRVISLRKAESDYRLGVARRGARTKDEKDAVARTAEEFRSRIAKAANDAGSLKRRALTLKTKLEMEHKAREVASFRQAAIRQAMEFGASEEDIAKLTAHLETMNDPDAIKEQMSSARTAFVQKSVTSRADETNTLKKERDEAKAALEASKFEETKRRNSAKEALDREMLEIKRDVEERAKGKQNFDVEKAIYSRITDRLSLVGKAIDQKNDMLRLTEDEKEQKAIKEQRDRLEFIQTGLLMEQRRRMDHGFGLLDNAPRKESAPDEAPPDEANLAALREDLEHSGINKKSAEALIFAKAYRSMPASFASRKQADDWFQIAAQGLKDGSKEEQALAKRVRERIVK